MWCELLIVLTFFSWTKDVQSLENEIGRTPAMGWISWTGYGFKNCHAQEDDCINERMIMEAADLFVSEGYKDAGYEYIIIDGPWRNYTYENNEILANKKKFPNGIKYLVDYVHSKGLKFGIYTQLDNGEKLEAETFAKWELDYIKLDSGTSSSGNFAKVLNETGRPMALACSWPYYHKRWGGKVDFEHLKNMCNSWRYHDDIHDSYESVRDIIDEFGDLQDDIQPHAGPGHFNNPDMLMIGNSGLSIEQCRTQMAIWAILAAPLMMSHPLKKASPEAKEILLNAQIIAVNQDPMGMQGRRIYSDDKNEVWIRKIQPVYNGSYSYAIAISSKHESNPPSEISVNLTKLELQHPNGYLVLDLFHNKTSDFQTDGKNFTAFVMPSGTAFFKFTPIQAKNISEKSAELISSTSNPSEIDVPNSTNIQAEKIVNKSAESSDATAVSGFFIPISFVLLGLLIGVGVSYIFFKREQLRINYEQFDSRLAFWRREPKDNDLPK